MFKRVEKKLAKKKKEDELGLSEEIKAAVGLVDDDSSSDESEASSSTSNPQIPSKRKRLLDDEPDSVSSDGDSEGQSSGTADNPEDYEDEPGVQMSVEEALHDPLYIISIQPDIRGCAVCPRKLLKNNTMASVHMKSQAHQRRMSKFKEAAASAKPDDDAQPILTIAFAPTPLKPKRSSNDSSPPSNRAAKRIAKFEKMKAKRQKHKAGKARSIAAKAAKKLRVGADSESETNDIASATEPPKKKSKLERPLSPGKLVEQNPLYVKQKSDDRPEGDPLRRKLKPPKESQTTGAKTNLKFKPTDEKKKRKERN